MLYEGVTTILSEGGMTDNLTDLDIPGVSSDSPDTPDDPDEGSDELGKDDDPDEQGSDDPDFSDVLRLSNPVSPDMVFEKGEGWVTDNLPILPTGKGFGGRGDSRGK
mmetsp:Transcript_33182/g.31639  ORF Transcript_33182/g.31639 Transcript_33182/m.31639 type:complete len:107 (-) Transcript_33182:1056-1376(-)